MSTVDFDFSSWQEGPPPRKRPDRRGWVVAASLIVIGVASVVACAVGLASRPSKEQLRKEYEQRGIYEEYRQYEILLDRGGTLEERAFYADEMQRLLDTCERRYGSHPKAFHHLPPSSSSRYDPVRRND